jgi:peptidoglycan/LPS O-acetylase OafA/YrhL
MPGSEGIMSQTRSEVTSHTAGAAPAGPRPLRTRRWPELDGLRGVAVALVVVYHVGDLLWPAQKALLLPGGALGVDLFFVLSGFLITSLLLAERDRGAGVDLPAFARRRALRLVPGMLALFAVVLVIAVTTEGWYDVGEVMSTAGWSLSFTANFAVADGRPFVLGHLWTIAVEGQFYLVWAVAVAVAVRFRHALGLLAAGAAVIVVAVASWRYGEVDGGANLFLLYLATPARFDAPMVGALAGVALASGRLDRLKGRPAAALALVGLATVLACAVVMRPLDPELYRGLFTLVAVAAAAAVVGAVRAAGTLPARLLSARPLVLAGTVSYSLYLWHLPIFTWVARLVPDWWAPFRAAAGVLAAAVAAGLSYRFVELPFLRRRGGRGELSTTPVPAVEPADGDQPDVPMEKQRSSSSPNAYAS